MISWDIKREVLSDGSEVYNVVGVDDDRMGPDNHGHVALYARSMGHALDLLEMIKDVEGEVFSTPLR